MDKRIKKLRYTEIKLENAKKLSFSINEKYIKKLIRTPSEKRER